MFLFSIGNPIHFFNPIKLRCGQRVFFLKKTRASGSPVPSVRMTSLGSSGGPQGGVPDELGDRRPRSGRPPALKMSPVRVPHPAITALKGLSGPRNVERATRPQQRSAVPAGRCVGQVPDLVASWPQFDLFGSRADHAQACLSQG